MKKVIIIVPIFILFIFLIQINYFSKKEEFVIQNTYNNTVEVDAILAEKTIDDWKLTLVNYENELPNNFEIQLGNIDNNRKFDVRAIDKLNEMLKSMKNNGINDIWVQSAYRSIEYQRGLFNDSINKYIKQGKSKKDAEKLTLQKINKPRTSEHNLGLAVDFNYVDYSFEETKGINELNMCLEEYIDYLKHKK